MQPLGLEEGPVEAARGPGTRIARRVFLRHALVAGASASLVPPLLAACTSDGTQAKRLAARGGTLRYGSAYNYRTFDPAFADTEVSVDHAIYEGLVTYAPGSFEIANQLAEEFEPLPDGLGFRFRLKQGIPFHDGLGEVTAEDVKFTYERTAGLTKPVVESFFVADWAPHLDRVEVSGKYEGTIVLNRPFAPLMTTTLPTLSGLVISKRAVEERGEDFASQPVGTGPYRVASFIPKRELVLQRFEDYGGASSGFVDPFFDEIVITKVGDANSIIAGLSTEELDAADFPPPELDRITPGGDIHAETFTSTWYTWIGMNVTNPSLSDIRVREAIRLAVDVPSIIEGAYNGAYERASAILPPSMPVGYWEAAPLYERNVDAARALLQEAGTGQLELVMRLLSDPSDVSAAEIVQASLAEVGIDLKLETQDEATFFAVTPEILARDQLVYVTFASFPDPFWSMQWFTCEQVGVFNMMSWCDERFDHLLAASTRELDPEKRTDIYIQMQQLWDANANAVWIAWPSVAFAMRSGVTGSFRPDGSAQLQAFSLA
jgi:peptide/nickel transport system substrate-binding protein